MHLGKDLLKVAMHFGPWLVFYRKLNKEKYSPVGFNIVSNQPKGIESSYLLHSYIWKRSEKSIHLSSLAQFLNNHKR